MTARRFGSILLSSPLVGGPTEGRGPVKKPNRFPLIVFPGSSPGSGDGTTHMGGRGPAGRALFWPPIRVAGEEVVWRWLVERRKGTWLRCRW